jgi:uncharacterized protein (DUF1330 family)
MSEYYQPTIDPSAEGFTQFFERAPVSGPILMLNLLRFRNEAALTDQHPIPRSGRKAFADYSRAIAPLLEKTGARVVLAADAHHALIAPPSESWDQMILVEYPSRDAFVAMLQSPEYQAITHHRQAALADSRLIVTTPVTTGKRAN